MNLLLIAFTLVWVDGETKRLDKEVVVEAPVATVWHSWTTQEGISKTLAADAKVELKIGGPYEWYFSKDAPAGSRGSEGCTVLSYIPYRMLAFTWNAPPKLADLRNQGARTQVVVRFEPEGEKTRVKLTQVGFGSGPSWEEYYKYFDRAWPMVLRNLREGVKGGNAKAVKWTETKEGKITVRTTEGALRNQEFELIIAAPSQLVWDTMATTDGFRKLAKTAEVELKPGGKYAIWPGASNKVLAYVPGEMLSVSGSAPEKFPNVRKGGTWGAYFLEPLAKGNTRLVLVSTGFKSDDQEHADCFQYFLKANPQFLTMLANKIESLNTAPQPQAK